VEIVGGLVDHQENFKIFYGSASADLEKLADRIEKMMKNLPNPEYHKLLSLLAYRHPWRPKRVGWIDVLDQLLHFLYSTAIFMPVLIWPSYGTAAFSGFLLGAVREWEQWKELDLKIWMICDRLEDVFFFTLAGIVLYFVKTALLG
jgi:hypothetical protein